MLLGLLVLIFGIIGCSSSSSKESVTLQDIIKAYTDKGVEIDPNKKPFFQMIGADDGIIFEMDKSKVAVYQFKTKKKAEEAKSSNDLYKDWITNENYLLESYTPEAKEIFLSVK